MKKWNLKILLPVAEVLVLVVSVLALQGVMAGIGLGIAGLLVFGPNVVDVKGKTGGIVYGKNKSGPYTRARVKPRNPNTDAQSVNRQLHRDLMKAWKRTEVNQAAYNEYASLHPVSNKIGSKICLSGINWFVRFNRMAKKANPLCGLILTPPVKDTLFPVLTGVTVSANAATNSVIVEPIKRGDYVEGMVLDVIATRQLSYGVSCPFGFRSLGVYNPQQSSVISNQLSVNSPQSTVNSQQSTVDSQQANDEIKTFPKFETLEKLSGIDITNDYVSKFGQLTAGMKIFVKVRLIMPTGEVDLFMPGSAVVN